LVMAPNRRDLSMTKEEALRAEITRAEAMDKDERIVVYGTDSLNLLRAELKREQLEKLVVAALAGRVWR